MSVRSRIEAFEALSRADGKDDSGKDKKNEATKRELQFVLKQTVDTIS